MKYYTTLNYQENCTKPTAVTLDLHFANVLQHIAFTIPMHRSAQRTRHADTSRKCVDRGTLFPNAIASAAIAALKCRWHQSVLGVINFLIHTTPHHFCNLFQFPFAGVRPLATCAFGRERIRIYLNVYIIYVHI